MCPFCFRKVIIRNGKIYPHRHTPFAVGQCSASGKTPDDAKEEQREWTMHHPESESK
jgi:hypothetical protein